MTVKIYTSDFSILLLHDHARDLFRLSDASTSRMQCKTQSAGTCLLLPPAEPCVIGPIGWTAGLVRPPMKIS